MSAVSTCPTAFYVEDELSAAGPVVWTEPRVGVAEDRERWAAVAASALGAVVGDPVGAAGCHEREAAGGVCG
ncbi:MAG: hypothetical protein ACRDUS_11310 [Mycobacterium sp.]